MLLCRLLYRLLRRLLYRLLCNAIIYTIKKRAVHILACEIFVCLWFTFLLVLEKDFCHTPLPPTLPFSCTTKYFGPSTPPLHRKGFCCPWKGFAPLPFVWEKDFGPLLFLEKDFTPTISIFLNRIFPPPPLFQEMDLGLPHPTLT